MSKLKKLKSTFSLLIFASAICSFAMMQGFEFEKSNDPVYITLQGGAVSGCNLSVTDNNTGKGYEVIETLELGIYSVQDSKEITTGNHYTVSVCNPRHGDTAHNPNMELIKGQDGKKKNVLTLSLGNCAE